MAASTRGLPVIPPSCSRPWGRWPGCGSAADCSNKAVTPKPRSEADQRQPGFRVVAALQIGWRLRHHDFQGRAHMRFQKMSAVGRSVGARDNNVRVHARLAVLAKCEIADQADHFDL